MYRPHTILVRARRALRPSPPGPSPRPFHTTPPFRSVLFNLNGLAGSRESQYLSKERGIPRTEYSSNISLIRSSEVDPFAPAPGASKSAERDAQAQAQVQGSEATPGPHGSFGSLGSPYAQVRKLKELSLRMYMQRQEIESLKESVDDMKDKIRTIFKVLISLGVCLMVRFVIKYIIFHRDRNSSVPTSGHAVDGEADAGFGEGPAKSQQELRADEVARPAPEKAAPDDGAGGAREQGRRTILEWLMWAPGSAAK